MLLSVFITAGILSSVLPEGSYEPVADSLDAVKVTADKGVVVSREDTIIIKNSLDLSEALLKCPGLYVGDNGGLAGLKTISLRGMGSAHTSIYLDGVRIGNVQSGQNDIGMLGVSSMTSAIVDYAQNSVSFQTSRPKFGTLPISGDIRMSAGSFGTYLPSVRLDFRLSDSYSLSANASGTFSKGDFKCADGTRRANNDITQGRASIDLFGLIDRGDMHFKAFYNNVSRGTPGALSWPSDDRQNDMNAFVQGLVRKRFTDLYSLDISAKAGYDDIYYTSSFGDSNYGQTEVQLNTSHGFTLTDRWKASVAADVQWDRLKSTNYTASRTSVLTALAAAYRGKIFSADLAVEYYGSFDKRALSRHSWSPSASIRVRAIKGLDVVAFGKRAYRVPTFNELYYVGYGNPSLKPEDAWLSDIGVEYNYLLGSVPERQLQIKAKLNAYYNFITDKITSAPTLEDPSIWAPYNIGKVRSTGVDLVVGLIFRSGNWTFTPDVRYSFNSAIDRQTNTPVPYIAAHVISANADISWRKWTLNALWQMRAGRSDGYGKMPDWNTLDATLLKSFKLGKVGELSLKFTVRNIFDCRYESVSGYPMPGRSFMGGLDYSF